MKNKFPMRYVDLKDKIKYYKAIEEGDKANNETIVYDIASAVKEQHTFRSQQ